MAKYIAHSSIDERGNIIGGEAGDQTAKEVCIRTMYFSSWDMVLRIENEKVRTQFANNMIDLAKNNNVGYDQGQRNSLLAQAKKVNFDFSKITTKCECDCSSAITACVLGAIHKVLGEESYNKAYKVLVVEGNSATTSTLKSRMSKLTNIDLKVSVFTASAYVNDTAKAVFGDIYNKAGSHVICYIDDGVKKEDKKTDSTKIDSAMSLNKSLAGTYKTTSNLHLRKGAGKNKDSIVVIPKGTEVKNYGYYTSVENVKWLLIQVTVKNVVYTGFSSSNYLKKA